VRVLGERGAGVLDEPVSAVMTRKVISCRQSDHGRRHHGDDDAGQVQAFAGARGRQGGRPDFDRRHRQWRVREFETEQEALQNYIKTA